MARLEEKDYVIIQKDETIAAKQQENLELRDQHRDQMHRLEDDRNRKDSEILKLTMRISELELQLSKKDQAFQVQQSMASSGVESKVSIKLKWREGKRAPCEITNICIGEMAAAVDGNYVYVMEDKKIYVYNTSTFAWSQLPDSKSDGCALAIVNNFLTLIGGNDFPYNRNKLLSLTREGEITKWTEEFPPMPTGRWGACALCTGTALIVAGGQGDKGKVATIEILNTATLQWSTAVDLPQPMFGGSLLQISDNHIYTLGAYNRDQCPIKSVYMCTLNALLQSCNPQLLRGESLSPSEVWSKVTDIPAKDSAYVSLHGQLLAVGGKDSDNKTIAAIHVYHPTSNSWEVISHMAVPCRMCYATVLPDNQLIVVGGKTGDGLTKTDSVEIAISV